LTLNTHLRCTDAHITPSPLLWIELFLYWVIEEIARNITKCHVHIQSAG